MVGVGASTVPSRRRLVLVWFLALAVLAGALVVFQVTRTAGDDPDPGRQRPGILDLGELPIPVPDLPGLTMPFDRRTAVFFAADDRTRRLCERLRIDDDLDDEAVVLIAAGPTEGCPEWVVVADVDLVTAAAAFGLPEPRGDVAPTGYAIVDSDARIRYRTLDPVSAELLDEVETMIGAVE